MFENSANFTDENLNFPPQSNQSDLKPLSRHRKRKGGLITLVVLGAILIGGFFTFDYLLRATLQTTAEVALTRFGMENPQVEVKSGLVTAQLWRSRIDQIEARSNRVVLSTSRGPVELQDLQAKIYGLETTEPHTVQTLFISAKITSAQLVHLINKEHPEAGLRLEENRFVSEQTVFGNPLQIFFTLSTVQDDSTGKWLIELAPDDIGTQLGGIAGQVDISQIVPKILIPLPELPQGLKITQIQDLEDGFAVHLQGTQIALDRD